MKNLEKYKCSKHGNEGNLNCTECWARLGDLLSDADDKIGIYISATDEDKKKLQT